MAAGLLLLVAAIAALAASVAARTHRDTRRSGARAHGYRRRSMGARPRSRLRRARRGPAFRRRRGGLGPAHRGRGARGECRGEQALTESTLDGLERSGVVPDHAAQDPVPCRVRELRR